MLWNMNVKKPIGVTQHNTELSSHKSHLRLSLVRISKTLHWKRWAEKYTLYEKWEAVHCYWGLMTPNPE